MMVQPTQHRPSCVRLWPGRNFKRDCWKIFRTAGKAQRCELDCSLQPNRSDCFSTPLSEIPKVIEPIANGDVDLAFGSRALDRKLIGTHQPWRREQAGRVFNLIVRLATGMPFWDTQCGFKAFRLDVCRPILEKARTIGFAFDVELLFLAYRAGLRLREIPVRWNHAEGSKVHVIHDSLRMLREVIALRLSS